MDLEVGLGGDTELIALCPYPSQFWARRSLFSWPDAVFPVVGRDEVPAWVADYGDIELAEGGEDVGSVAVGV